MTRILGVFTCFNRKEKSLQAIRSLREGNPELQIDFLVADDSSTDGTGAALAALSGVEVLYGNGNSFYTGGMRIALGEVLEHGERWTGYDYLLLLNDDVDFYENSISYLVEQQQEKVRQERAQQGNTQQADSVIFVGPTCEPTGELSYGGVLKRSNFRPKHRIVKAEEAGGLLVDTFNANCVLIPWDSFLKIGNMDPVYRHSLGDFDYGLMAGRKGVRAYVSDRYVGVCSDNPGEGTWRDPKLSRRERFRKKESVKGVPFREWWHYLCKNYNVVTAIIYSFSPYIRILMGI